MQTQRTSPAPYTQFLAGGCEMGALIRQTDWAQTPVGPVETWPQSLRTAVNIMLRSSYPMFVWWGPDLIHFHNDAYSSQMGDRYATSIGRRGEDVWPEVWDQLLPMVNTVFGGESVYGENLMLYLNRREFAEENYFNFSYSPIIDEVGAIGGLFCVCHEETANVLRQRRLQTFTALQVDTPLLNNVAEMGRAWVDALARNALDIPFSALYLIDQEQESAQLIRSVGIGLADGPLSAQITRTDATTPWPLWDVVQTGEATEYVLDEPALSLPLMPSGSRPHTAYLLPIRKAGQDQVMGVLVSGLSPNQLFDADYRDFLQLIGAQMTTAFAIANTLAEERSQVEAQLQQERIQTAIQAKASALLKTVFQQAPVAIAIFRGPEFVIDLANETMCRLWGRTVAQVSGKPLFEVLPEAAGQGFEELLTGVLQTGDPFVGSELPSFIDREGRRDTVYWTFVFEPLREPDNQIDTVIVVATDMTESVLARKKIEESEARFRQLADSMPQIVWTAQPDGYIDYYNRQWYDYTGFDEAFGDQSWIPILHADDVVPCVNTWYNSVNTGLPYQIEYRFIDRHNPGHYRWFLGRATPIRDAEGTVIKWFGTCTDIDDQKRQAVSLEQRVVERTKELELANHSLEQSNFDLMQFASVASHDLKEPLRKIYMFGNILRKTVDDKLTDIERDYFGRMINASDRMQRLVDDILNLSKLSNQAVFYADTDLNDVINRILDDLEVVVQEKAAHISVKPLPTIDANTGQIHQLFQNLISNALKFNNKPVPVITIEAVAITPDEAASLHIDPAQYVSIEVHDNGIGFDEVYREKIFGVFQRLLGARYGGTGIGLAICKKIVENHRGFIQARSEVNEGATFTVILPLKQE